VAAARAKLNEGHRVVYVEAPPGRLDQWLQRFGLSSTLGPMLDSARTALQGWQAAADAAATAAVLSPLPAGVALPVLQELEALGVQPGAIAAGKRPYNAVLHCLCEGP
jgi:protease-4